MNWGVVESWLHTLGFHQYTQAFIDNGYDDLDVCRQIGDADLDAIGVTVAEDRASLLRAVSELQQSTNTVHQPLTSSVVSPVYFTLENLTLDSPPGDMEKHQVRQRTADIVSSISHSHSHSDGDGESSRPTGRRRLSLLVAERLTDDVITLTHPPYISQVTTELTVLSPSSSSSSFQSFGCHCHSDQCAINRHAVNSSMLSTAAHQRQKQPLVRCIIYISRSTVKSK